MTAKGQELEETTANMAWEDAKPLWQGHLESLPPTLVGSRMCSRTLPASLSEACGRKSNIRPSSRMVSRSFITRLEYLNEPPI